MPQRTSMADGIAATVEAALSSPPRLGATRLVAVDGPSGSGKTTLARPLAAAFAAALDGTVIRPQRRTATGGFSADPVSKFDLATHPDSTEPNTADLAAGTGAAEPVRARQEPARPAPRTVTVVSTDLLATWEQPLDWWPILEQYLLQPLAAGITATMPVTQWVSGKPRPGGEIRVPPVSVLILEGVSAGREAASDRISTLVWVEMRGRATRLERAVARDGEAMRAHLSAWQQEENTHFIADQTRSRADIVISGESTEQVTTDPSVTG